MFGYGDKYSTLYQRTIVTMDIHKNGIWEHTNMTVDRQTTYIEEKNEEKEEEEEECSICLEKMTETHYKTLECGHHFHMDCLKQLISFHCPLCRHQINIKKTFNITEKICGDEQFHYGVGYAPYCENGPCRFCFGKPLSIYLKQ